MGRFVRTKVAGGAKLTGERESFVVGASDEMTEDALEGFDAIVTEYSSATEALLVEPN